MGNISGMLQAEEETKTPLTRQLDTLTRQIFLIAGLALLVSVVINLARGETFTAIFHAAVAFAIGALPENMPAVVTTILAYGTQALAKVGAIMKRLQSTETLGSTSAINSDKTGTLTLNEMTAVEMVVVGRRYAIEGTGYSSQGQITHVAGQGVIPLDPFLLPMVLASDAVMDQGALIGDPTEGALVALAAKGGVDAVSTRQAYPRVAELPFDAAYKLMATFHRMTDDSGAEVVRCFVKGAPDELLSRAGTVHDADVGARTGRRRSCGSGTSPRTPASVPTVCGCWPPRARTSTRRTSTPTVTCWWRCRTAWSCLSLVGIVDPPRPTAKASIATAEAAGIRVRMITGDHAVTAGAIAGKLGIHGSVMTGAEFAAMDDDAALERIDEVGVIARVTPQDKVRLVELLRRQGRIVAMTGDGVNDAPALKSADIGIAMGITGTEVAKDAAVMVLTDDNFSTIVKAVELGRGLYDNLVKYIRFQMGCLFGFIVSFLGAAIFNIAGGVPFLPLQTLWINFTTMLFQAVGLGYGQPAAGPDGPPPPRPRAADPAAPADGLARHRRPHHGRRHPRGHHLGRGRLRPHRGPDHGSRDLLHRQPAVLPRPPGTRRARSSRSTPCRTRPSSGRRPCRILILVLTTVLGPLQAFLGTVALDTGQWLVCIGAALPVLLASELRVLVSRRRAATSHP